jgi:hypothetical protein
MPKKHHAASTQGALDLEELEDGSPLEMCYLLGKLQEKGELPSEDLLGACCMLV